MSLFVPSCGCIRSVNLYGAAVALLSGLQEGVSAHWTSVDAIGGGSVQQAGGVHLVQELSELLQAAAAELLWVHKARRARPREDKYLAYFG